ncbi:hypothetical protein ES702_00890 [subsurface metagenome]
MPMFDSNKEPKKTSETVVGHDVTLTGSLKSDGNIQVNGKVKGKVITKNDILIGEKAVIDGSLKAKNIVVTGMVKGNLEALEDLEISPSGKVFGDVLTKNFIIKKGAIFTGKSTMGEGEAKEMQPVYELEEEAKKPEEKTKKK